MNFLQTFLQSLGGTFGKVLGGLVVLVIIAGVTLGVYRYCIQEPPTKPRVIVNQNHVDVSGDSSFLGEYINKQRMCAVTICHCSAKEFDTCSSSK